MYSRCVYVHMHVCVRVCVCVCVHVCVCVVCVCVHVKVSHIPHVATLADRNVQLYHMYILCI